MTEAQQREGARQFFYRWNGKGREDEDARSYWIEILTNILGVERVTERVDFEKKVIGPDGNTKRIDVYIPETHVLIEQKSLGIPLDKPQAGHGGMTPYIALPEVSAGSRRYIPMGFMDNSIICSNKMRLVPDASLYHFGILASNVHMAWVRTVGGYYGPSYQYSVTVIYNNFPWPTPTEEQKKIIEQTASNILTVRKHLSGITLEKLYDPDSMPPELRKAHQANDRAVMQAYGMPIKETDEAACVAWLMRLYQEKVSELEQKGAAK